MGVSLRSALWASLCAASFLGVSGSWSAPAQARMPGDPHEGHGDVHREHDDPHREHRMHGADHAAHLHDVGPAGATYDLRFIDAMVQHHTGALRMSEFLFNAGYPGVGALARDIWREQAQEIRAMNLWRKRWYPGAPVYPVVLAAGGDPDSMDGLTRKTREQIEAMRMMNSLPSEENRAVWFLEGMLHHHGAALKMAHDALEKSSNNTIRRFARDVIVAQRAEIRQLRGMLRVKGMRKDEYFKYDPYFSL